MTKNNKLIFQIDDKCVKIKEIIDAYKLIPKKENDPDDHYLRKTLAHINNIISEVQDQLNGELTTEY